MPMTVISNGIEIETQEIRLVSCMCGSVDHHIIISRSDYSDDPEHKQYEYAFYITLDPTRSFFGRVWLGLKYIFGFNSTNYYHDILLTEKQFKNISSLFDDR